MSSKPKQQVTLEPQVISREFLRKYYTILNYSPENLHCFYHDDSLFLHDGIDPFVQNVISAQGRNAIGSLMQNGVLNYRNLFTKVNTIEATRTLDDGLLIQVLGDISNDGQPMRPFSQTFVLVRASPIKYYVHNDIFRYRDFVVESAEVPMVHEVMEKKENHASFLNDQSFISNCSSSSIGSPMGDVNTSLDFTMVSDGSPLEAIIYQDGAIMHAMLNETKENDAEVELNIPVYQQDHVNGGDLKENKLKQAKNKKDKIKADKLTEDKLKMDNYKEDAITKDTPETKKLETDSLEADDMFEYKKSDILAQDTQTISLNAAGDTNTSQNINANDQSATTTNESNTTAPDLTLEDSAIVLDETLSSFTSSFMINDEESDKKKTFADYLRDKNKRNQFDVSEDGSSNMMSGSSFLSEWAKSKKKTNSGSRRSSDGNNREYAPNNERAYFSSKTFIKQQPAGSTVTNASSNDNLQVFIGNICHDASEKDLRTIFEEFGPISRFRIHTNPARSWVPYYAFATYESMDGVRKCLANKDSIFYPPDSTQKLNVNGDDPQPEKGNKTLYKDMSTNRPTTKNTQMVFSNSASRNNQNGRNTGSKIAGKENIVDGQMGAGAGSQRVRGYRAY